MEDLSNGMSLVNSGSVDNGLDLKQKETTPESAEPKELTTESGSLCKVPKLPLSQPNINININLLHLHNPGSRLYVEMIGTFYSKIHWS